VALSYDDSTINIVVIIIIITAIVKSCLMQMYLNYGVQAVDSP